jgi:hypothetical protein
MRNVPAKSAGIVHHSFSPQQGVVATPLTLFRASEHKVPRRTGLAITMAMVDVNAAKGSGRSQQ